MVSTFEPSARQAGVPRDQKGCQVSDQYIVAVRASDAWKEMWHEIDWAHATNYQKGLQSSIWSLPNSLKQGILPPEGVHVTRALAGAKKVRTQCRNIGLEANIFKLVWPDELEEFDA